MLFLKSKTLSHRQTALIGFVLAVMSVLMVAVTVYLFPLYGVWLNHYGVYELDLFLLVVFAIVFLATQGLILFGFPLYYAQDKKSHMTGLQILVYALLFILVLVVLLGLLALPLKKDSSYSLEDLNSLPMPTESMNPAVELSPAE